MQILEDQISPTYPPSHPFADAYDLPNHPQSEHSDFKYIANLVHELLYIMFPDLLSYHPFLSKISNIKSVDSKTSKSAWKKMFHLISVIISQAHKSCCMLVLCFSALQLHRNIRKWFYCCFQRGCSKLKGWKQIINNTCVMRVNKTFRSLWWRAVFVVLYSNSPTGVSSFRIDVNTIY